MGRARWLEQPAYFGWLAPLLNENLLLLDTLFLRSITDDQPVSDQAQQRLEEARGALLFLGQPEAAATCQALVAQCQAGFHGNEEHARTALEGLEQLVSCLKDLDRSPGLAPQTPEGAFLVAFEEQLRLVQDHWEVQVPLADWEAIGQSLPVLQRLAWGLNAIGLTEAQQRLQRIHDHVEQLCVQPPTDPQEVLRTFLGVAEQMVRLRGHLPDALAGQPIAADALPVSEARQVLTALSALVVEEVDSVRHRFEDALKNQETQADSLPAMERIAAAMELLEQPEAAKRAWLLARRLPAEKASIGMAEDIVFLEAFSQSLLTHAPHLAPSEGTAAEGINEPTTPAWTLLRESFLATAPAMQAWVSGSRSEDAQTIRKAFKKAGELQGLPESQAVGSLAQETERLLAQLLGALGAPGLHEKAAVLHAFRSLNAFLVALPYPPAETIEGLGQALERVTKVLQARPVLSPAQALRTMDTQNLTNEWPALSGDSEEALWDFLSNHWAVLSQVEHPHFWTTLSFVKTALALVGAATYARILAHACEQKTLDFLSVKVLEILFAKYHHSRPTHTIDQLLVRLEQNLLGARQALARGDEATVRLMLSNQHDLLSEMGSWKLSDEP